MQRDVAQLARSAFDLVVVGGGIYGAWVTLDAAQRGLKVALVERGDFGAATSGNSHRLVHGGLRYLQHGDLSRFRQSVRERRTLLKIAPELVQPLAVLAPTSSKWMQHRLTMRTALKVNDVLSWDRNRGLEGMSRIPAGRLIERSGCGALAPDLDLKGYTGGALFFDAQLVSPERLMVSILSAAVAAGAQVANYVAAEDYLGEGERIAGIRARDLLEDRELAIRARVVVNCAGPWTGERIAGMGITDPRLRVFKAAVLLTRDVGLKAGLALPGKVPYVDSAEVLRKNYRNYFLTPWRGLTLVGTFYARHLGPVQRCSVSGEEIDAWLDELNESWPELNLSREDVRHVSVGLLPHGSSDPGKFQYAKRYMVMDHEEVNGTPGLISVIGVKYTTARGVAEEVVSLAERKLGRRRVRCRTAERLELAGPRPVPSAVEAAARLCQNAPLLREQLVRAVRDEMAVTLADAVVRRTDLTAAGYPGDEAMAQAAGMMAELLGWDLLRIEQEISQVRSMYEQWSSVHAV